MTKAASLFLHDAIKAIAARYPTGCVEYFENAPVNLWHSSHEDLDNVLIAGEKKEIEESVLIFKAKIFKLITEFKSLGGDQKWENWNESRIS